MLLTLLIAAVCSSSFKAIRSPTPWSIATDQLLSTATTISMVITPGTEWAIDTENNKDITIYFHHEAVTTPAAGTAWNDTATATLDENTDSETFGLYVVDEFQFVRIDLTAISTLYVYASYEEAGEPIGSNAVVFEPTGIQIAVITPWTIDVDNVFDTKLTKMPILTIDSTVTTAWKADMNLRFEWEKEEGEPPVVARLPLTANATKYSTTVDTPLALGILTSDIDAEDGLVLKLVLEIDGSTDDPYVIDFTVKLAAPDFTLVTKTLAETAIVTPVTVTITAPDSVRANDPGAGWDDNIVTAVIKKEKTPPTGAATGFFAVGTQAAPGDDFLFTIDLTTLAVTDDLKELYVFVGTVDKPVNPAAGLSNDNPTWLDAPGTITFQPEAPLEGKVVLDPSEVAFADLGAPGEIKVSIVASRSNTLAALGANSRFKIEYTDATPTTKSVSGAIKAHEARSNTIDYYYIDNPKLDDIGIPDAACDAKVYIYPTGTRNAIETVLGITSDTPPPEEPEFVLDPAYVLFADVASLPVIEVKPDIEVSWPTSGMKLTFSYEAPAANAAITYDIAVTKVDTKYVTAAEASLATLLIEEEDLPADVTVTFHDGTKYLTHPFTFKVLGKEPPPQVTFTIEPNEIDYADALKTQEIVITPAADHGWPTSGTDMKFRISNPDASPAPNPVTGAVTIAAGATAETKKYSIPEETAISGLFAAAPTANVVLKIEVTPDGVTWLNHKADYTVKVAGKPEAAMGVSPLLSLLAALVFLFVKLF